MDTIDLLTLPFDQYQRYTAVAQIADRMRTYLACPHLRVLDVGGFFRTGTGEAILPLTRFLPRDPIVAVDLVAAKLPGYLLSHGQSLPFRSRAFDLAVSCDTLEHVPPAARRAFLDELMRVARHCLVLIAPFDSEVTRWAEQVLHQYLTTQGLLQPQLQEHIDYGLPAPDAVRAHFSERGLAFLDFADGYLYRWLIMMLVKHTPGHSPSFHLELDRCYNQSLSPADRQVPAYRRVFVVVQPGDEGLLDTIADPLGPSASPSIKPEYDLMSSLISVLDLCQQAGAAEARRSAENQQTDPQLTLAALEAENRALRQLVAGYESGRFIRFMRRARGWRRKLGV